MDEIKLTWVFSLPYASNLTSLYILGLFNLSAIEYATFYRAQSHVRVIYDRPQKLLIIAS